MRDVPIPPAQVRDRRPPTRAPARIHDHMAMQPRRIARGVRSRLPTMRIYKWWEGGEPAGCDGPIMGRECADATGALVYSQMVPPPMSDAKPGVDFELSPPDLLPSGISYPAVLKCCHLTQVRVHTITRYAYPITRLNARTRAHAATRHSRTSRHASQGSAHSTHFLESFDDVKRESTSLPKWIADKWMRKADDWERPWAKACTMPTCRCMHVTARTLMHARMPERVCMSAGAQHADQHHRAWATTSSGVPKLARRL